MGRSSKNRNRRDFTNSIANRRRLPVPQLSPSQPRRFDGLSPISTFELQRARRMGFDPFTFRPEQVMPTSFVTPERVIRKSIQMARNPIGYSVGRLYYAVGRPGQNVRDGLKFVRPRSILACIRRKIRKEVLHALKKTGGAGGNQRPPRFTELSRIRCR